MWRRRKGRRRAFVEGASDLLYGLIRIPNAAVPRHGHIAVKPPEFTHRESNSWTESVQRLWPEQESSSHWTERGARSVRGGTRDVERGARYLESQGTGHGVWSAELVARGARARTRSQRRGVRGSGRPWGAGSEVRTVGCAPRGAGRIMHSTYRTSRRACPQATPCAHP